MNISIRSIAFTLLLALGIASCKSDSPSEPGNNGGGKVMAKTGSTYTYDSSSTQGGGATGAITYSVAADNITIGSRTGVRLVKQGADTAFMFTYNTDGSVSMHFPLALEDMAEGVEGVWIKLPVNGGTGESIVVIDTTIIDPELPFPLTIKLTMTSSSAGATTVSVNGASQPAHNVNMVMDLESNLLGNTTGTTTITWVPSIGFYGKMVSDASFMGSSNTMTEVLTSFSLVK
jgi:hypothetical protein